jgi:hypothetical protein
MAATCRIGFGGGGDGRVRRPPAHVAGAFAEVAVDDLDGVGREGDHPRAVSLTTVSWLAS